MIKPKDAVSWALLLFCFAAPISIAGLNCAAGLVLLALGWAWLAKDDVPWRAADTPLVLALAAYVGVAIACSAAGLDPKTSFAMLYKDVHKPCLLVVLLVALRYARPAKAPRALLSALALISVVGVGQSIFLRRAGDFAWVRARGFVHPVIYGELLALLLLGGLCLRLEPAREDRGDRRLLDAALLLGFAAFVLNQTRGAFLGLAAGLLALAWTNRRLRALGWAVLLGSPLLLLVWELLPTGHSFGQMIARMHQPGPNPYLARLTLWRVGLDIFRDHPWLGVGPGHYKTVFTDYFHGTFDNESDWGSAHNLYIHQAAERGVLGLLALAGVLWTMTARAARRAFEARDAARLWAFAACAAFLVMNLTEVAFQTEQVTSLLLFIWAWAETAQAEKPA